MRGWYFVFDDGIGRRRGVGAREGGSVNLVGGSVNLVGGSVNLVGGSVNVVGGSVNVVGGSRFPVGRIPPAGGVAQ